MQAEELELLEMLIRFYVIDAEGVRESKFWRGLKGGNIESDFGAEAGSFDSLRSSFEQAGASRKDLVRQPVQLLVSRKRKPAPFAKTAKGCGTQFCGPAQSMAHLPVE